MTTQQTHRESSGLAALLQQVLARLRPGLREMLLLGALYVAYSAARVLASGDRHPALDRADGILAVERVLHLDVEHPLNAFLFDHRGWAVAASFYYASAHYVVTPLVLLWLWRRHRAGYAAARRALVVATLAALVIFVVDPTAPPRLVGYHDILATTADVGWWSTSASAPKGFGGITNQLAAMPSMHVGWAVWCALALRRHASSRVGRSAGWVYAAATTIVVLATANHWTLDAVAGAAIVAATWVLLVPSDGSGPLEGRLSARSRRSPNPPPGASAPLRRTVGPAIHRCRGADGG